MDKIKIKHVVIAFGVYELVAYLVNLSNYQAALSGQASSSFVMPLDLIGAVVGYPTASSASGSASGASTASSAANLLQSGIQNVTQAFSAM